MTGRVVDMNRERWLGMMIRRLFGHVSPPSEPVSAVAPPPIQPALDLPEHPWMQRRDIGGV